MPKYREDTKFMLEVSYAQKLAKRLELYQEQGVFEESDISINNLFDISQLIQAVDRISWTKVWGAKSKFDKTRNKNGSNFTQR